MTGRSDLRGEEPILSMRGVGHRFPAPTSSTGPRTLEVLGGIDLTVSAGEVLGVVGESGSGKTTLGRIAAGLLRPAGGEVRVFGKDPFALDGSELLAMRSRLRMVFQSPGAALNPFLRAYELCEEPLIVHCPEMDPESRKERLTSLATELGFDRFHQYPGSLSGGEKRRASLVRALAVPFRLLVADEPTSGLDAALEVRILRTIDSFRRSWNAGMLLISHHLGIVEVLSDSILVLFGGRIVERTRRAEEGFRRRHPYSRALWAAAQLSPGGGEISRPAPLTLPLPAVAQSERGCPYAGPCALRQTLPEAERRECDTRAPILRPADRAGGGGPAPGEAGDHMVSCHHFERTGEESIG